MSPQQRSESRVPLRRLTSGDLDRVMALEVELFGSGAWSRATYESELVRDDRRYIAALDPLEDTLVVGYAGVALGPEANIMTIGVAGTHRRRGIAAAMLDHLIDQVRRARAEEVFLEVRLHDEGAQRLYRRAGFERVGVRRNYYQPEGADALVMRLRLRRGAGPVGAEPAQKGVRPSEEPPSERAKRLVRAQASSARPHTTLGDAVPDVDHEHRLP